MGWSCAAYASHRLEAIRAACVALTGSSNVYTVKGTRYFFETSRHEHFDGAITGTVHRFVDETHCVKAGGFRIEGNGGMTRGPKFMRSVSAYILIIDKRVSFYSPKHGPTPPTDQTLRTYIKTEHMKQYMEGGVNRHVALTLGFMPYPKDACIMDLHVGNIVATWKAATFEAW